MRRSATTLEPELKAQELDFLLSLIRKHHFSGKHLEIGTAAGGTLCRMMKCFSDEQRPSFVVVDPMQYFPQQFETVKRNLKNHQLNPNTIDFRVQTSDAAFANTEKKGETFDFILIDGSHKIHRVMQDLRWTRQLNPGGIFCLHDYSPAYPGVFFAANRFLKKNPNYQKIGQTDTLLALKKIGKTQSQEVNILDLGYARLLSPILQLRASLKKRKRPIFPST